ncbi:hypothetical protein Tco_0455497 [Tanacetum coccineum]
MDVTVEQWLDLMYCDHMKVDIKVKEGVVSKWLVRSYNKQFDEHMEIKKQRVTHEIDFDMEYDPSDVEFAEWLASKFYNHKTMDRYTKNALWIYWTRGDDEVELTDEEFSDPDDENLIDNNEVAKIFRIETDIFDFETPICKMEMTRSLRLASLDHRFECMLGGSFWVYAYNKMRVKGIMIMGFYGCIPTGLNVCKMVEKMCEKW